jgi:cytochrome P450
MAWPDYRFQNQMSALEAKAHKEITKHLASGYTLTNLLQAEREMDSVLEGLQRWLDHFATTQNPMDLGEFFHYTIYDITGEVFFSKPLGFLDAGFDIGNAIGMVVRLNRYAAIAGFFYGLYTFLAANPIVTAMNILPMGYLNELTLKYLRERMEKTEARFDVVEHWLKEHQQHPDRFTMRDIFSNITFNIPAGSDSPANVMHAIIYYISRHPTAYRRVREEILAAMAEGRCQTTIVSYTDSKDLVYMQACIKETLRIFSALAVSIPRVAGKDGVTIGDRTFPEGTILSLNPWVIHYSKEFWGPDANEFSPNRWFEKDNAVREKYLISVSDIKSFNVLYELTSAYSVWCRFQCLSWEKLSPDRTI